MSNQAGDRYSCSDPNCGCELEVKTPSRAGSRTGGVGSSSAESGTNLSGRTSDLDNSASTSSVGDFGSQGSRGEGVFGTSGTGSEGGTRQGRYGSDISRTHSEESSGSTAIGQSMSAGPTCFCGQRMKQKDASRSARA